MASDKEKKKEIDLTDDMPEPFSDEEWERIQIRYPELASENSETRSKKQANNASSTRQKKSVSRDCKMHLERF